MQQVIETIRGKSMQFDGSDLEIRAKLGQRSLTIDILKSGACVHRVTVDDASGPLEHGWLADLFAREHRVEINTLVREVHDYVDGLNINQG